MSDGLSEEIGWLLREIDEQKVELDRLRAEIIKYQDIEADYERNYNRELADNDRLRAENAELKSENIRLETRLQDAENYLHNTKVMLENALVDIEQVTGAAAVPPRSEP